MPMNTGIDNNHKVYQRQFHAKNGMSELLTIVAGLQKDMKRLENCLTLPDAQNWIQRNKKKNWQAHEMDITGPAGVPDGIPEVFITDSKGNLRVINGWTLTNSKFPYKKTYRETFRTRGARKANPYTVFRKGLMAVDNQGNWKPVLDNNGNVVLSAAGNLKAHNGKKPTARQFFNDVFFRRAWNMLARRWRKVAKPIPGGGTKQVDIVPAVRKAQSYTRTLADTFKCMIDWSIINRYFLGQASDRYIQVTKKQEAKFKRNKNYKDFAIQFVYHLANDNQSYQDIIKTIRDMFLVPVIDNEHQRVYGQSRTSMSSILQQCLNRYNQMVISREQQLGGAISPQAQAAQAAVAQPVPPQQVAEAHQGLSASPEQLQELFDFIDNGEAEEAVQPFLASPTEFTPPKKLRPLSSESPLSSLSLSDLEDSPIPAKKKT